MEEYKCSMCDRKNCKLWRIYQGVEPLYCKDCTEKKSKSKCELPVCDQIGWYVPATVTGVVERDGTIFYDKGHAWGYTSVPKGSADWWGNLPL